MSSDYANFSKKHTLGISSMPRLLVKNWQWHFLSVEDQLKRTMRQCTALVSRDTVSLLVHTTPHFTAPDPRPLNSPTLISKVWGVMQEHV